MKAILSVATSCILAAVVIYGAVIFGERERARMRRDAQPEFCSCKLLGSSDRDELVMGFDSFVVGEARGTRDTADSMLIPARTACGPVRLRAVFATE